MHITKKVFASLIMLYTAHAVSAQVSQDSVKALKEQKQSLVIEKKINDNKLKLASLENSLEKTNREKQDAVAEAQKAAEENEKAASRLSNDPQNKKLARQAEKAGDAAKKYARRARQRSDDLDDLNKKIGELKNTIAEDEKLAFRSNRIMSIYHMKNHLI